MQYRLVYIKASPGHRFAGVGMGGNVMISLSMISNMTDGDSLYVDMETNNCVCAEDDRSLDEVKNCWEYYFRQKPLDLNKEIKVLTMQETGKINFSYNDITIGGDLSKYIPWRNRFYNNFQLTPVIRDAVDKYYNNHIKGKTTLGVHIRLTDQEWLHHTSGAQASIIKALEIIKENPDIEQVFLATDDSTIIPLIEKAMPCPVIYYRNVYRADGINRNKDPYAKFNSNRPRHRYLLALEVLWDIFTLTKCDYFLKAEMSAISIVACILHENIKKVYWL